MMHSLPYINDYIPHAKDTIHDEVGSHILGNMIIFTALAGRTILDILTQLVTTPSHQLAYLCNIQFLHKITKQTIHYAFPGEDG